MRFALAVLFLFLGLAIAAPLRGQTVPPESPPHGPWEFGVSVGGGNGLFAASSTRFLLFGGRVGRALTRDHLHGWGRGNFEFAADFMPVFAVFQPGGAVYGGNFTPIMLVWNFTSNRRIVPYVLLSGGGLVTTGNVPPGNTSSFNFIAGGSFGIHVFTRPRRALTFETHWVHISNANLGTDNPQLVSNFIFTIGYSWFK